MKLSDRLKPHLPALAARTLRVSDLAVELGVSKWYLSRTLGRMKLKKAPSKHQKRVNQQRLKATRQEFLLQQAAQALAGTLSPQKAALQAKVDRRTIYRYMEKLRCSNSPPQK